MYKVLFSFILIICMVQPAHAADFSVPALEALIDPLVQKNLDQTVGAVVTVVHDGHIVFNKGYGTANLATQQAVNPEKTLFRIGSITKTFTAIAVMQLVEQGKLNLDSDINTYLKAFKVTSPFGRPITLRHLLTHSAGFEDSNVKIIFERPEDFITLEQSLKDGLPKLVRPPGEAASYSNHGLALAGYIVEVVSKKPYAQYIQDNILDPLGMDHTSAMQPLPAKLKSDMSLGYLSKDTPPKPFELISISAAGSISASGSDMARYMQMLLNGGELEGKRILKSSALSMMLAPQWRFQPGELGQGFGFFRELYGDQPVFSHEGATTLFLSLMKVFPKQKLGIFISVNSTSSYLTEDINYAFKKAFFPTVVPIANPNIHVDQNIIGSSYRSLRVARDTVTKILGLIVQYHPKVLKNGHLEMQFPLFPDENMRLAQISPLVYRVEQSKEGFEIGHNEYSFSSDGKYMMSEQDYTALERVPMLELDYFQFSLLGFGLLSCLLVILAALSDLAKIGIARVWKIKRPASNNRWPALLAFSSAALFILTFIFDGMGVTELLSAIVIEPLLVLYIGASLGLIAALLTLGLLFTSFQAWRKGWWTVFSRVRYSTFTLSCLGLVFFMHTWNLLGFRF